MKWKLLRDKLAKRLCEQEQSYCEWPRCSKDACTHREGTVMLIIDVLEEEGIKLERTVLR